MQNQFMEWFGLSVPILQAPIGSAATIDLVKAVGRTGGMGSLALTWTDEVEARKQIDTLRAASIPFFVNFVLRFGTDKPRRLLEQGLPAISLSWGVDASLIAQAKSHGIKVGVQAGTAQGAKTAVDAGADFVILQGIEAGGHVQSTTSLQHLMEETMRLDLHTPLIAAGGIATGEDVARFIKQGASAVMMGTRFLASKESRAHDAHKQAIVNARATDTAFTNCFDIDWPYAMHRVLRNSTLDIWEAAGSPSSPSRPGEGDVIAMQGGRPIIRYSETPPLADANGDVLAACLYAGTGVEKINDIKPAGEIVTSLWANAKRLL
jgi:nitronate monooxygenase